MNKQNHDVSYNLDEILEQTLELRQSLKNDDLSDPELSTDLCIVDLETQTMLIRCTNGFEKSYIISTAKANNIMNSFGTPLGKHNICEKFGENEPIYTIFEQRKSTGNTWNLSNNHLSKDLILTRILRLKGEEPGINLGYNSYKECVDSYDRYIYIHGTNREDLLGTPASKGCIRMSNKDIIEVFDNVKVGAEVYIYLNAPKLKI